ncbi:MAG: hypothetical protein KC417_09835, partial [Myxococcales bacterium]|nr:hypothetical protein [Myxococcales bacterium]
RDVRFAALGVLAFLTRPDAGLLLAFGITWRALGPRIAGGADSPAARIEWKSALRMAVVIAAPVMGYLAWKWSHFGGFVPLTLLAKTPVPSQAAQYTLESVAPAAGLFLVALWGAFRRPNAAPSPEARVDERRIATARVHVAFALLTAASLVAVGPDWMPAGRLLVPAIPALAIAFASMVPTVKPPSWRSSAAIPAWLAGVAVAVYVAHAAWLTVDLHGRHDHRIDEDEKIVTLVRSLQQDGMASFGTVNIGLVGYVSPTAPVFDLGGLTDAHIARLPGPHLHKHPEAAYLAAHAPDVFLLTSSEPIRIGESGQASYRPDFDVESHVFSLPWFQRTYRYAGTLMLSPNYYYHAFVERRSFGPETR